MSPTLPMEEKERRLKALREASTVTEAARRLDLNYMAMWQWARENYPGYSEEFSKPHGSRWAGQKRSVRVAVTNALEEAREIMERREVQELRGVVSDLEHALKLLRGEGA